MESLLKYGAIGLALALSILVYQLIRIALKKEKLSKDSYYLLFSFMGFALIVMFVGISIDQMKNKPPKKQETLKSIGKYTWATYNRSGCSLALPDVFKERSITNDIQSYRTNLSDEIDLKVDCSLCKEQTDFQKFQRIYNQKIAENKNVTYQIFKDNFFVVTGYSEGDKKYYYKGLLKNKSFYLMSIEYPSSYQYLFDDVMTGISRSFK